MRFLLILGSFIFSSSLACHAQSEQKAEKEFLKQLNGILKSTPQQHWGYEGVMTIDSAFTINKQGILSATVRYTNGSSIKRVRMAAPARKIQQVAFDIYLILEFKENVVTLYESEPGSNKLKEISKRSWFHIGVPLNDELGYEDLQRALDNLLKYYR